MLNVFLFIAVGQGAVGSYLFECSGKILDIAEAQLVGHFRDIEPGIRQHFACSPHPEFTVHCARTDAVGSFEHFSEIGGTHVKVGGHDINIEFPIQMFLQICHCLLHGNSMRITLLRVFSSYYQYFFQHLQK